MNKTQTSTPPRKSPGVGFRYDETAALYTSQVVVNTLEEMIILECSSGFVRDDSGAPVLPIDSRLAMSGETARKLGNLLLDVADELTAANHPVPAQTCESWLKSASTLQTNLRRAADSLPRWDD